MIQQILEKDGDGGAVRHRGDPDPQTGVFGAWQRDKLNCRATRAVPSHLNAHKVRQKRADGAGDYIGDLNAQCWKALEAEGRTDIEMAEVVEQMGFKRHGVKAGAEGVNGDARQALAGVLSERAEPCIKIVREAPRTRHGIHSITGRGRVRA